MPARLIACGDRDPEEVCCRSGSERHGTKMKQDIYDLTVEHILDNQEKAYRLAYSYVQDKDAALDVVQDAACQALE